MKATPSSSLVLQCLRSSSSPAVPSSATMPSGSRISQMTLSWTSSWWRSLSQSPMMFLALLDKAHGKIAINFINKIILLSQYTKFSEIINLIFLFLANMKSACLSTSPRNWESVISTQASRAVAAHWKLEKSSSPTLNILLLTLVTGPQWLL